VRASYKSGSTQYNLYAIPGQKPGDKGQVFVQSNEGFENDLPPVRLSDRERDGLINEFQELERVSVNVFSDREVDRSESRESDGAANIRSSIRPTMKRKNMLNRYAKNANPSKIKHNKVVKDNKTFWSSGIENGDEIKIPKATPKKEKDESIPLYKQLGRPTVQISAEEKKQLFHMQMDELIKS
jgi:hypothetical protein